MRDWLRQISCYTASDAAFATVASAVATAVAAVAAATAVVN